MRVTIAEIPGLVGRTTEPTTPITITQDDVNVFAKLTGDEQWIHTDVDRAQRSAFGSTIVHGYFMLSLIGGSWFEFLTVTDSTDGVNYGLDRVRFLKPVPVGSTITATATFTGVKELDSGVRVYADVSLFIDGDDSPALVAETIVQFNA